MRRFQVLFVCTGNICRSPLAERLLRERLRRAGTDVSDRFLVHSVGLGALVDQPMDSNAAVALTEMGGDADGFVARQANERIVSHADLVLTAERHHRARVLEDNPAALRRTFTLREFAALCALLIDDVAGAGPDELVRRAAAERPLAEVDDYDVPDPYRRSVAAHATTAGLIRDAVDVIAPALVNAVKATR